MNKETLEQLITKAIQKECLKQENFKTTDLKANDLKINDLKTQNKPNLGIEEAVITVPIGVSARHIHVTKAHLEVLFGPGAELHPVKTLMGGQYAAKECITLVGTNLRVIENVRILGPVRKETQIELAKTDAIRLGINPPLRESGKIKGSVPITIVGPKGALYLEEGCIIAKRHIHMNEKDAALFGLTDNQQVSVKVNSERKGILEEVQVRVDKTYTLEMHIDTDEANALGISSKDVVRIIKE